MITIISVATNFPVYHKSSYLICSDSNKYSMAFIFKGGIYDLVL